MVCSSCSRPPIRVSRALILSETAPSALARDLRRALKRAAWTGGVGAGVLGSMSFSYSMLAVEPVLLTARVALETAICNGTIGWSSAGAEGPDELLKRDPPSKGFLPEERDLSMSV